MKKMPNQIHGALAYAELLTQIAYAKIIVKLLQNAYASLREPVNTNVSASAGSTSVPHTRRFLHLKKMWLK